MENKTCYVIISYYSIQCLASLLVTIYLMHVTCIKILLCFDFRHLSSNYQSLRINDVVLFYPCRCSHDNSNVDGCAGVDCSYLGDGYHACGTVEIRLVHTLMNFHPPQTVFTILFKLFFSFTISLNDGELCTSMVL